MRGGRVHPSQVSSVAGRSRVSSCSRSSKASSVLSERVKLAAEKAAMVAEVSLLQESGSLAQERLRLEHQERALVKPVTVNIRDGQNLTAITEASRIFNEDLGL